MIPSARLLFLVFATAFTLWIEALLSAPEAWQWTLIIVVAAAALFDAIPCWWSPRVQVDRHCNHVWPVGHWGNVGLRLRADSKRQLLIEAFDHFPSSWQMEALPLQLNLLPDHVVEHSYRVRPDERGDAQFSATDLHIASPWRLWWRRQRVDNAFTVKVFPDFSKLLGHTLLATQQRVPSTGALRKRRRGEGTNFMQLREYRRGDSLRSVDWKATARYRKPISREYQEERDQQVVFLLDTGRRMLARDGAQSHFDHALNAMLTLAYIAQRQGDSVGVMSFGQTSRWLAPQKGRSGFDRLLAGVYDLQPGEVAPDYTLAATDLLTHLRKRAFVVWLTNLRDEDENAMKEAQALLSSKHLVLCASLRENALDEVTQAPVGDFPSALRLAATELYLDERQQAIKHLGLKAHQLVDVAPRFLASALTNRYWEIKESALL